MTHIEGQHPLFDVPPPVDDERGFRGPVAASAAQITYRQLDYWARTGLVEPTLRGAHGSGSQRLYSFRDILALSLVKRLLDTGVSLANIRTALGTLRAHGTHDLAGLTLLSDGVTVYECSTDQQVIDLVRGGQGVFGIAIGQVWTDVQATLTHLPTETPTTAGEGTPDRRCGSSARWCPAGLGARLATAISRVAGPGRRREDRCQPTAISSGHGSARHHPRGGSPAAGGAQWGCQPAGGHRVADHRGGRDLVGQARGWPQYVRPFDGTRIPEGLWIDWRQLREDLEADERARAEFSDWATSYTGRRADEVEYERTHDRMVPRRAWHGASSSELVVLRIAVALAPGGLLGDGLARLDEANTSAVLIAVAEVAEGRYITPDWADV